MINSKISEKLIRMLVCKQQSDGSFESISANENGLFLSKKIKYKTIFQTGLILNALSELSNEPIISAKQKSAKYLLSQRNKDWTFNYWDKDSNEYQKFRIPNDLDDSFVALAGLWQYDQLLFTPKALAQITNILIENEAGEGGPYYTWIYPNCPDKIWQDVDPAVNANIAYFLHLNDIELPNLSEYFEQIIQKQKYQSKYYPNEYSTIYYLSRFYHGKSKSKLEQYIFDKMDKNNSWGNVLNDALMISALLNLNVPKEKLAQSISFWESELQEESNWVYAFCMDPSIDRKKYHAGSKALTIAFCLEAMEKIESKVKEKKLVNKKSANVDGKNMAEKYYQSVLELANHEIEQHPDPLRKKLQLALKEMAKKDEDGEIILLPWVFAKACDFEDNHQILPWLSLANMYGWIAYTIYDDFLDEEGQPAGLPIANVATANLDKIYHQIVEITGNKKIIEKFYNLMARMENANLWEVTNCRIENSCAKKDWPDFGDLSMIANKSIPHSMGPLSIIMLAKGAKPNDEKRLEKFFHHYLVARQLNDDAHDWQEDLKRGQINAAGAMVLADFLVNNELFVIKRDMDQLKNIFWTKTIKQIAKITNKHIRLAKDTLADIAIVQDRDFIKQKLDNLAKAAQRAVSESMAAKEFIKEFK
jgi:hypothetical protein